MKTHILLLDEKAETRRTIKFLLKISGHRVTEFLNHEDAVNWIANARKTPLSFDLLLVNYLDTNAQTSTLVELFNSLGKTVPIVLLTHTATETYSSTHIESFRNRAGYFFCTPEVLIETVNAVVDKSAQQISVAS
ncbi:MAG: response regulator [Desulfuromonadales bacterium]|nr:response regulator [Desulfuromonadales bacterium]